MRSRSLPMSATRLMSDAGCDSTYRTGYASGNGGVSRGGGSHFDASCLYCAVPLAVHRLLRQLPQQPLRPHAAQQVRLPRHPRRPAGPRSNT